MNCSSKHLFAKQKTLKDTNRPLKRAVLFPTTQLDILYYLSIMLTNKTGYLKWKTQKIPYTEK